jgi:hypothetical protein
MYWTVQSLKQKGVDGFLLLKIFALSNLSGTERANKGGNI